MKRFLILMAMFSVLLTSCGDSNVQITLPDSFFNEQSETEIIAEAQEKGITAVKNNDGSYTYTMSKSTSDKMIKEYNESIDDMIKDILSGDTYVSYKDIKYNSDFTKISLYVNQEEFENNFLDGLATFGLYIGVGFYQIFNGVEASNIKATFEFINDDTKEVFRTTIYPDDLGT